MVTDTQGRGQGVETPLQVLGGSTRYTGEPLRSRVDPNGVLYSPFGSFDSLGVMGVRPHPLPPSWLSVSEWDGTLGPGGSVEIALTFNSDTRAIDNTYTAALQVFEAETGNAIEVPLSFEIVEEVGTEDEAAFSGVTLQIFPNPAAEQTTVVASLPERADFRLVVYDALGRRVAVLHEGVRDAGQHRLAFATAAWPSGVYLVRAEIDAPGAERVEITERLTVVR